LGELVFASRNNEMKQLADITWEKMKSIINDYIEFNLVSGIVLDWILLPHTPFFKMCDKKILIKTDEEKRRNRIKLRDKITDADIDLRDNASIPYNEEDFDEIINN
jgi:dephospho-CoA kinase